MNIPNFYCTFLPSLDNQSKINPATQTQQIWAPLQTKKPNPSISTTTKNANPESPKPISSDHDNHNPDQSDQSTRLSYLPSSRWSHHRNNAIEQRCRDTPSPIFDATTAKDTTTVVLQPCFFKLNHIVPRSYLWSSLYKFSVISIFLHPCLMQLNNGFEGVY